MTVDDCDPYGTPPMFAVEPGKEGERFQREKPPKTVAHGTCPTCGEWTGIYAITGHLAWKHHSKPTWGRFRFSCPASLVTLCDLPALTQIDHTGKDVTPTCKHPISYRKAE